MKTVERVTYILRPTEEQKELIRRNCNNARFAYNWGVAIIRECLEKREKFPSGYSMCKKFNEFKRSPGYEWLVADDASQRATKYAISKQLNTAISKFLRKQKRPPTFKTKRNARMSYNADDENTRFGDDYVLLEKLGKVKCYHNFPTDDPNVKLADPTIIFTGDRYELSVAIVYRKPVKPKHHHSTVESHSMPIGIDVGLKHLATTSSGKFYDMPNLEKIDRQLAKVDRRISKWHRKFKSVYAKAQLCTCDTKTKYPEYETKSRNLLKLEKRRRQLYLKSFNIRKDFRCKAVADIVSSHPSAIVIEDIHNPSESWKIVGHNKHNKRISDSAIGDFLNRIKQKCDWLDIPLIIADKHFPSTKTCSCCGNSDDNILTRDRMFKCRGCGYIEDRDMNAAYNLRNLALE